MYDIRCKKCGAYLDLGEHCDCEQERERRIKCIEQMYVVNPKTNQLVLCLEEKDD